MTHASAVIRRAPTVRRAAARPSALYGATAADQARRSALRRVLRRDGPAPAAVPPLEPARVRFYQKDEPRPVQATPAPTRLQREDDAGESTGAGATAPRCQVDTFGMSVDPWDQAWPSGTDYSLRLPVDFSLKLASGTSRSDCTIGQDKRGRVEYDSFQSMGIVNLPIARHVLHEFPSWTTDAPAGQAFWWDGTTWHAGDGSWSLTWGGLRDERAGFHDKPGFAIPSSLGLLAHRGYIPQSITRSSFPIYWGGVGRTGHFEFRTYVKDRVTGATIRTLTWGMLIDYSTPQSGHHYFYL